MTLDVLGEPVLARVRRALPAVTRRGPAGAGVAFVVFWMVVAAWVVALVRGMDSLPHGSSLGRFLGAWALVEVAVLLPAVFPVSRADLRSLPYDTTAAERFARGLGLAAGYLLVWLIPGLVAYAAWRGVTALADENRPGAITLVTSALILAGLYEFTPWQRNALAAERPPYAVAGAVGGPARDVVAGARMGLACAGSSVGLLVLLVAVGLLNPAAMVAVTLAGLLAGNVPDPRPVRVLIGVGLIAFAILAAIWPGWLSVY